MVIPTVYNGKLAQKTPQLKSLHGTGLTPTIRVLAVALTYAEPSTPGEHPLKDPVQDIKHIRAQLSEFDCVQFTALYETKATFKNILDSLRAQLSYCQEGDLFVLYLAGHALSTIENGFEFITYYEKIEEQQGARFHYQDILEYIKDYCPPGVHVLQIRDTCYASPHSEEIQEILLLKDKSIMVLAACAVSQLSYESSPAPHSLFLRQMVSAAEALKSDVSIGKDLRASIIAFWNAVLLPIPVFKARVYQSQYPQLVPRESQLVEFVSFLVRLIQQLRDSSPE